MVKVCLVESTEDIGIYHYFVEGKKDREHGIIKIYIKKKDADIVKVAPDDFQRWITAEEINELRNGVNQRRIEDGEPELTEDEWPIETEGYLETKYADHAIQKIIETLGQGNLPKSGMAVWY